MLTEYRVPANPMLDFGRQMGRFFSQMAAPAQPFWPFNSLCGMLPASNIWEDSKNYYIEVAAPGVAADQVELSLLGNDLTVTLKRNQTEQSERGGKFLRRERMSEDSTLSVSLPDGIDEGDISADLENGILLVQIPKSKESQAKKIPVKTK